MKHQKNGKNPYATNCGGKIQAPNPVANEPRATVTKGDDLRKR